MTKALDPLDVFCPFCKAAIGVGCTYKNGVTLPYGISHVNRRKEARRVARAETDAALEALKLAGFGPLYNQGHLSIENAEAIAAMDLSDCTVGVQVAWDGRVWLCVNGVAWIRFKAYR